MRALTQPGDVVILGAGQAGASLALRLRQLGHLGGLTLIGDEPHPPYQRPPLSKKYLMGALERERLFLRPERFYADQGIELVTGCRACGLDRAARRLEAGGRSFSYDRLVFATGARPRPLQVGGDPERLHVIRSLADIERLAAQFRPGRRLLIVGGGFIGLEAAAVAVRQGLEVTLIEQAPRILQRVVAKETSEWFRALHLGNGVAIREGTGLEALEAGAPDAPMRARLTGGEVFEVDLVIAGIGVLPNQELAAAAGLACDGGILVDARGQSSDPAIRAVGDCARFPWQGGRIRLESVQNAVDQAEAVAADLLGIGQDYAPVPWFWSDQYDTRLQIVGIGSGHDRLVTRSAGAGRSHWYFADGKLIAVDAIDDPRAHAVGKRLLEAGRSPCAAQLADPATDLKTLLG